MVGSTPGEVLAVLARARVDCAPRLAVRARVDCWRVLRYTMGGDYYTDDSGASRSVGTAAAGGGFSAASAAVFVQTGADDAVLPPNRLKDGKDPGLVTSCATPIVVALDVTASRGDDAKILYDKLPMFYGSIMTNACAPPYSCRPVSL